MWMEMSYRSCNKLFLQEHLYQDVFGALKHLKIGCNAVVWQMWKVGDIRTTEVARYLFKKKIRSAICIRPSSKFRLKTRRLREELATVALVNKNM